MARAIKYFFIIVSFIIGQKYSLAQQSKIDSLLQVIKTDKADTNKLIHLTGLSYAYEFIGDFQNGLMTCKKALNFAEILIQNSSDKNKEKVKQTAKKYKAAIYASIGRIYTDKSDFPEALKNEFASLKIQEEIGDKMGAALSYGSIGTIYYFQENYPVATKHYLSSLKALELIGYKNGMAACYGNLGFAYYMQKKYPEAIKYQTLGLNIFNELGDMQGVASSYSLMGMIYHDQGNYPEVYKNFLASLKIYEDLGDKPNVINALANIAGVYIKQKEYNRAIKYLSKAEKLAKEIGAKSTLQNIYEGYSEADSATGDFKAAYKHFKLYKLYKDSIDNEETRKQTVQSQMTFEFEKKTAISKAEYKGELERQNLIAEEKSKKQKTITWSVIIGLIVVLGFASLIFRSLRITRKQKQIIEIKNKETVLQKDIIEEKHKEITDSINYAERIQRSFLASKTFLDENLKNYFVFFQPKDVVSGDFYWASKLNDGKIILATADSTGHGVPGAIMSILNISSLEKAIEEGYTETADILNHTRSNIIERLKRDGSIEGGKDGMDCSLITFDFITQEMTYSAANNPIWVIRQSFSDACKNELLEFKADKMPVGKHDKDSEPFTQHSFQLQKNDIVYTLTDGLPDQFGGAKGKKFMHKQLKEILIEICNLPMNDQKDIIKSKFLNWKADTEQVDDVLLIGVRI